MKDSLFGSIMWLVLFFWCLGFIAMMAVTGLREIGGCG